MNCYSFTLVIRQVADSFRLLRLPHKNVNTTRNTDGHVCRFDRGNI